MAARRTRSTEPTETTEAPATEVAETSTGGLQLAVQPSQGVQRAAREQKDNETLTAVKGAMSQSLTDGALAYTVATKDDANKVVLLLQRGAKDLGVGLRKSVTANRDGSYTVDFQASTVKRERKYSVQDIRAWYGDNFATDSGPATIVGPVPVEIRDAFKVANKFEKGTVELHGQTFTHE